MSDIASTSLGASASQAAFDSTYETQIRADILDSIPPSSRPTAVVIAGPPGTAKLQAATAVGQHLTKYVGPFAIISADLLRQYASNGAGISASRAEEASKAEAAIPAWYARLTSDALDRRLNLLLLTNMRHVDAGAQIAHQLQAAGYDTSSVVLAAERDRSLQTAVLLYEKLHRAGAQPKWVSERAHEESYRSLRDWVIYVEAEGALDRIQVLTANGNQLYANRRENGRWVEPARALKALDDHRERRLTARELTDSALRWQELARRFSTDAGFPRDVASQVVAWRNDAIARTRTDAEASRLLDLGLVADAFMTMDRHQFVKEFPQYAKAAVRLEQAIDYADKNLAVAQDRERFVAQAKERVAERIAEGRMTPPMTKGKPPDAPAR